jgi:hypothetical protein
MIFMLASSNVTARFKLGLITGIVVNAVFAITTEAELEANKDKGGSGGGSGGDGTPGSGWAPPAAGGGGGGIAPGSPLVPVDIDTLGS